MKILRIGGKNLASLAADFSVDFEQEPLASTGLFAICGPTGAGKSTLLDALCLALYGATPRLNRSVRGSSQVPDVGAETVIANDPRSLLRRGAAEGHAEVDFVGNDGLRYRARWSIRRAYRKSAGALQGTDMSLKRLPDLMDLGGKKTETANEIEKRIGLSFDQFTRAVLLAQNEFSAFLKADENERGELLETLTGSVVFSEISIRAYERFKDEQSLTRQLKGKLADAEPLAVEERNALDAGSVAAESALAAIDQRKAVLEQQLRWQQEAEQLRQNETNAELALAAARADVDAAAPRRRRLATLDAAEPARPLMADCARLDAEQAALVAASSNSEQELQAAVATRQQAAATLAVAAETLRAAENEQRSAAPDLDKAKALDASIAALAPAHQQAITTRDGAVADAAAANEALQAAASSHGQAREAQAAAQSWLAAHTAWEPIARQWPRWDKLMDQAAQSADTGQALAAQLADAGKASADAQRNETATTEAANASSQKLRDAETARQQSIAALAAFDGTVLSAERNRLALRRDALGSAEKTWSALAAAAARSEQVKAQAAQLAITGAAAQAQLDQALAAAGALASAAGQAERSLKVAQLACADSVEDMRASLSDGEACPVCGSAEHPYQHQNAQLHALLASLQSELDRCRQQVSDNQAQQATQRALAAATAAQAESLARELTALEESTARLDAEWRAQALAAEAPAPERRTAWFAAETAALKDSAKDLDVREQAARAAAQARDVAQQNCDLAAARNQQLQEAASAARTVLAHAQSAHSALADKKEQAGVTLAALLEDLDDAFEGGWRERWLAGPAAFRLARAGEAQQWSGQSNLLTACASSLGRLEAEHAAAATRIEQARSIESSARAGFEKVDADIAARRRERSALWAGKGVGEIEQALAGAIEQARSALAARQAGSEQAGLAETRAREVLVQIGQRKEAVGSAALAASQALAAWMAGFGARNPSLDIPGDVNELASLLAVVPEANAVERAALTAIDAAAATAATVLAERRARREEHQQSAPSGNLETLGEDLAALLDQRKQAHDDATALRLQLAQDDVRRRNAQALMSGIDRQQVEERRWGRLSELIGSADGKKFRNYAQQFTLDVLLGYANAHLAHLAKRYRLERVTSNGGPSLGLMVRDQDMGGEVRGVNSLSGGESFLVSLALALGLASLSSNRVRVESLFIDEGFGSLDSETLRVAMDALDGLQSMGRKVGVISHVQEMTERIATKIIVQPSGGGSSSVNVQ